MAYLSQSELPLVRVEHISVQGKAEFCLFQLADTTVVAGCGSAEDEQGDN